MGIYMKRYKLNILKKNEYKLYFYDKKYLNLGKKVIEQDYKVLKEYKNDSRTYVAVIEIDKKKYILKIPRYESNKILKKILTFFKKGEALRSLINIKEANENGLQEVMDIYIVGVKKRFGLIENSFFLSEYIEGEKSLEDKKILKILELCKKIHRLGYYHGDCNPYNFIFDKDDNIRIVDTQCKKMRFGNYKAHYDNLTIMKYLKEKIKYIEEKNIFYWLALIIRKIKK